MSDFNYTLVRSRRKTLAVHILPDGSLEVRAPILLSKKQIEAFLDQKSAWINRHQLQAMSAHQDREKFTWNADQTVLYKGVRHPIQTGSLFAFDGNCFTLPTKNQELCQKELSRFYKTQAEIMLRQIVGFFSTQMNIRLPKIKITSAKKRWGSCSSKNQLCFSWRLMAADISAIEYVAVHELAHTIEHNHSSRFWAIVGNILPDYKKRERILRQLQKDMYIQSL